jgi:hypothetical protein
MIHSFSGKHTFDPQCLIDAYRETLGEEHDPYDELEGVEEVALLVASCIDRGLCPRCGARIDDGPHGEKEIPSGSYVTDCRCIPICAECGVVEKIVGFATEEIKRPEDAPLGWTIAPVTSWPIDGSEQREGLAEWYRRHPRILS